MKRPLAAIIPALALPFNFIYAKKDLDTHGCETRLLLDQAHFIPGFWWYKINPHRTYVKGWKIAPSHYLNLAPDTV